MRGSVRYHCVYTYEHEGKVVKDRYQSLNRSYNTTNPFHIIKVLRKEIKEQTGRTVKDFLIVGKNPVNKMTT